jgi:hypothetical protein
MAEPDDRQAGAMGSPVPVAPGSEAGPFPIQVTRKIRIKLSDIMAGLALIISVGNALVSYQQFRSGRDQLHLSDLQIRPYVKLRPSFTQHSSNRLTINMISENISSIPANVVYHELKTWVDDVTTKTFLYNNTGDVLFQHKSGAFSLPTMPTEVAGAVISGKAQLMIGTCVVYGSISTSDTRRWEDRTLYSYRPHDELPAVEYFKETEIPDTVVRCDSSTLRSEWLQRKAHTSTELPSSSPAH